MKVLVMALSLIATGYTGFVFYLVYIWRDELPKIPMSDLLGVGIIQRTNTGPMGSLRSVVESLQTPTTLGQTGPVPAFRHCYSLKSSRLERNKIRF